MSAEEKGGPLPPEPLKRSMRLVRPYFPQGARLERLLGQATDLARDLGADLQIGEMAGRDGYVYMAWSYVIAAVDGVPEEYAVRGRSWEDLLDALIKSLTQRRAERCGLERCGA